MISKYNTEQEQFWAENFGDEYTTRNSGISLISANIALFSEIIAKTKGIETCLELGSNRGLNLIALRAVIPDIKIQAVEINKSAASECAKIPNVNVYNGSAFDFPVKEDAFDLTFTKGVLIHTAPEKLDTMYDILYRASKKYVLVVEYYNPSPVEITYRGHTGKLFKRDFAGELMDKYQDLELIDYGFVYHRDYNFPQDDCTWFLMEKRR